jgi:hypothetical protein
MTYGAALLQVARNQAAEVLLDIVRVRGVSGLRVVRRELLEVVGVVLDDDDVLDFVSTYFRIVQIAGPHRTRRRCRRSPSYAREGRSRYNLSHRYEYYQNSATDHSTGVLAHRDGVHDTRTVRTISTDILQDMESLPLQAASGFVPVGKDLPELANPHTIGVDGHRNGEDAVRLGRRHRRRVCPLLRKEAVTLVHEGEHTARPCIRVTSVDLRSPVGISGLEDLAGEFVEDGLELYDTSGGTVLKAGREIDLTKFGGVLGDRDVRGALLRASVAKAKHLPEPGGRPGIGLGRVGGE